MIQESRWEPAEKSSNRPDLDVSLKFKMPMLQALHGLSLQQTGYLVGSSELGARLRPRPDDAVSDANTLRNSCEALTKVKALDRLFAPRQDLATKAATRADVGPTSPITSCQRGGLNKCGKNQPHSSQETHRWADARSDNGREEVDSAGLAASMSLPSRRIPWPCSSAPLVSYVQRPNHIRNHSPQPETKVPAGRNLAAS